MKTIAPYAVGGILVSAGAGGIGSLVFLYAILRDWRFWLVGLLALIFGLKVL